MQHIGKFGKCRLGYTVRVADVTVNSYSRRYSRDSSSTRLARSHSAHTVRAAGMKVGSYFIRNNMQFDASRRRVVACSVVGECEWRVKTKIVVVARTQVADLLAHISYSRDEVTRCE